MPIPEIREVLAAIRAVCKIVPIRLLLNAHIRMRAGWQGSASAVSDLLQWATLV